MTHTSHPKTDSGIKNKILLDVIRALMDGQLPPFDSDADNADDIEFRIAAFDLAMDLRQYVRNSDVGEEIPSNDVQSGDGVSSPRGIGVYVSPARCVGKRLITVRRNARQLTVTFTANLGRDCSLNEYAFASIAVNEAEGRLDFEFTNDPSTPEGTFCLGYNGGSSRDTNSPGRILQLRSEAVPWLRAGYYTPDVNWRDGQLTISLQARGSSSRRVGPSPDRQTQRRCNA